MGFTNEQLERYSRHIILKEIGVKGQKKLLNAKVLIIGAGGLGAPASCRCRRGNDRNCGCGCGGSIQSAAAGDPYDK